MPEEMEWNNKISGFTASIKAAIGEKAIELLKQ